METVPDTRLDLSFARFDRAGRTGSPADLALLMVGVAARQAASRTAAVQARLPRPAPAPRRFAPTDGRFNARAARALAEWKGR